jgi:hypothetical protein
MPEGSAVTVVSDASSFLHDEKNNAHREKIITTRFMIFI